MTRHVGLESPLPETLQQTLRTANNVVVLTGAGISAESGVPTFRDAQTGMWARHEPMDLATPDGFRRNPALVWEWYQWRRRLVAESRPNAGHLALAEMGSHFPKWSLITQNVDGLHQRAGSSDVIELHGNLERNVCSQTARLIDPAWIARHADQAPPPSPHHRHGLARPGVVWFGEMLNQDTLESAFAAAEACDLCLVAGTSGVVQPAASIPVQARQAGATVVEINPEQTALSTQVHWHLNGTAAAWLPRLLQALSE